MQALLRLPAASAGDAHGAGHVQDGVQPWAGGGAGCVRAGGGAGCVLLDQRAHPAACCA